MFRILRSHATRIIVLLCGSAIYIPKAIAQPIADWRQSLSNGFTGAFGTSPNEPVPIGALVFYVAYLSTMWVMNWLMLRRYGRVVNKGNIAPRRFLVANVLLAAGDTAMFICFLTAAILHVPMGEPAPPGKVPLEVAGILTTSLTMSCYYLFLGLYLRDRFLNGLNTGLMWLVYVFFAVRVVLHYNPANVWVSMVLPPGEPNHTAWLRNAPLLIYGLVVVLVVMWLAYRRAAQTSAEPDRRLSRYVGSAMVALVASFLFYIMDTYFSHKLPHSFIWIVYTLKTIAYVVAAVLMWLGEFHSGGVRLEEPMSSGGLP